MLDPAGAFMRIWDSVILVALLYTAVIVPFQIAFSDPGWPWTPPGQPSFNGTAWPDSSSVRVITAWQPSPLWANLCWVADRFCDAAFSLDILFTFNLGVYDTTMTRLTTDRRAIALRYLSGAFFLDIVSTIPYDLIVTYSRDALRLSPLRTLRVLKLLRMARSWRVVARLEEMSTAPVAYLRLGKYVLALIFLNHWLACGLHAVAAYEQREDNWESYIFNSRYGIAAADPLVFEPTASQVYTEALLWAIGGNPNQIQMQSNVERGYSICAIVVLNGAVAYMVGQLFAIIDQMGKRNKAYEEALDELNLFIDEKHIPRQLSGRLRAYFRLQHPHQKHALDSWTEVLTAMPTVLRSEVVEVMGGAESVKQVPYFSKLPHNLLLQLAVDLKHVAYPPCEVLVRRGDDARAGALHVLVRGVVVTHSVTTTRILPSSVTTTILGEEALWPGPGLVGATATSLTSVEVHTISVAHLLGLLGAFQAAGANADCTYLVAKEGRRRWLRSKIGILVPAVRRVNQLLRKRLAHHHNREVTILDLLDAAEGRHEAEAASQAAEALSRRSVDKMSEAAAAAGERGASVVEAPHERRHPPHPWHPAPDWPSTAAYVMPASLVLLVVSRCAPAKYFQAQNAARRIQRCFRKWRMRRKFHRLRKALQREKQMSELLRGGRLGHSVAALAATSEALSARIPSLRLDS